MNMSLIFRLVFRDWRAGELHLLLASLLVAVGTVTTITMTISRIQSAMVLESASFLAADRVVDSGNPIPDGFYAAAREEGLTISEMMQFQSMVLSGSNNARTQLASIKAVDDSYPLRGFLKAARSPFGEGTSTTDVPAIGSVWLESRLFPALGVLLGDEIQVGYAKLKVDRVLISEPDRQFSMMDMAPRILMRIEDVESTGVVQPGSRLNYRLLLNGENASLDRMFGTIREDLGRDIRWRDVRGAEPRIGRALDRAESFFLIGGSMAVLLAGVAIALSAHRYANRHFDHVGIMKTLGATPNEILLSCIGILALLGLMGVALGLLVGTLVHLGLVWQFGHLLPPELPGLNARPFLMGSVTGLICLFAFALPPFLRLRNISPLQVIRRDTESTITSSLLTYTVGAIGSVALLIWYSGSVLVTFWLLLGIVLVSVGFGVVAIVLLRGGRLVGMQAGNIWRLALAGLQRRYKENTAQIIVFGLAIMLLLIMQLLRTSLISEWQAQLPTDTPNHVLLNVVSGQEEGVAEFLDKYATKSYLVPMYRGRIIEVNGENVVEYQRSVGAFGTGPRLSSTRELTWATTFPEDNTLISGEWWDENTTEHLVSIEDEYASNWGLKLGDELKFRVFGEEMTAKIASVRGVEWQENFRPNFFMILSPPLLKDLPASYMSFFFLPDENKRYITELISQFPTITVIDVDTILRQVQTIIDRVTTAVEWVLFLVMGSGALVLIASIQSSRDLRMKEHALLRSLGGTRNLISGSLTAEFALLGAMAGVVGVIGAECTVYLIESQILDLPYAIRPHLWALGPAIGAVIIAVVGYFGTRKLVKQPPMRILREV